MKEILDIPQIPYSVCMIPDVEYKRVPAMPGNPGGFMSRGLYMQLLVPRSEDRSVPQEKCPVVVYATGGGWATPQVRYRLPGIVGLAKRGFLVAALEYRGREYYSSWREEVEDVRSAVRYIRKHAAEYNGDPDKIVLMGDSAGGHLSMMSAYGGPEFDCKEDDLRVPADVSGVLDLFGPTEPHRIMKDLYADNVPDHPLIQSMKDTFTDLVKTEDLSEQEQRLKELSVTARISADAGIPPALIAQGDRDMMVPVWCAEKLYQKLNEAGVYAEYYLLTGARHGDMRFYESDMVDRYERFIRRCTDRKIKD